MHHKHGFGTTFLVANSFMNTISDSGMNGYSLTSEPSRPLQPYQHWLWKAVHFSQILSSSVLSLNSVTGWGGGWHREVVEAGEDIGWWCELEKLNHWVGLVKGASNAWQDRVRATIPRTPKALMAHQQRPIWPRYFHLKVLSHIALPDQVHKLHTRVLTWLFLFVI